VHNLVKGETMKRLPRYKIKGENFAHSKDKDELIKFAIEMVV